MTELATPKLSGTRLKLIACVAMAIDHTAVALVGPGLIYELMRGIGRLAFPVFCLGIAEGARYTRDWRRYLARLLLMAVVSEVPFDFVVGGAPVYSAHQNVMWELAAALVAVRLLMWADSTEPRSVRIPAFALAVSVALAIAFAAEVACLDYGFLGIALVCVLWALRSHRVARAVAPSLVLAEELPWVVAGSALIAFYDGTRGQTRHPWLFYLFYPAHLLAIALVAWVL